MKLSRRAMIKDGMLVVSAGMAMPAIFSRGVASAQSLSQQGVHFAQAASERTLIVVQMAGGNDGLNTVIPYNDALYRKMRPTLGIPEAQVLTLDGRLGFSSQSGTIEKALGCGPPGRCRGCGISQSEPVTFSGDGHLADARSEWRWY